MIFWFTGKVLDLIMRYVLLIRVHGIENVPKTGAAIIAINHASYFDGPLAGSQIRRVRPFRSIGKKELFDVPLLGWYLRSIGAIPLDRDRADLSAMRSSLKALNNGELFMMAPEGTRGTTARRREPQAGVGMLAHRAGVPVIPMRLYGTERFPWPGRVWVRIGKPVSFHASSEDPRELQKEYKEFARALMQTIYGMTETA